MRLFSEAEFKQQLESHDLERTNEVSSNFRIWQTKSGHPILIPCGLETYPDLLLDKAIGIRDALEEDGGSDIGIVEPPPS